MPLDPRRSRIIKYAKSSAIVLNAAALIAQSTIYTSVPFLFNRLPPKPMRTSMLSGAEYVHDVLYCGNPKRIQEVFRMKLEVFQFLCSMLEANLSVSKVINVQEKVAMFLWIVARSASTRDAAEQFQHSTETISRCFHEVLNAIYSLVPTYIKLPNTNEIPTAITSDSRYYRFFNDCIGALDGTHIAVKISEHQQAAFRNRKGYLSQNVFACCDLDKLIFTYVLAGWEGSAHDGTVLEAAFDAGFSISNGKYYLGDAGFALTPWCITPYRGVRYHLREWSKANDRPKNAEELFNLRHSSLRNAIERIFGVLKKRFQVLTKQLEYSYEVQVRLVQVLCCLHNIIRVVGGDDDYDAAWKKEFNERHIYEKDDFITDAVVSKAVTGMQTKQAKAMRDRIAAKMWTQYLRCKSRRQTDE